MKTILFFILLLPVTLFGQCSPLGTGTLNAIVNGNSVILQNDTAERNCASWYLMEISQLEGDTLQWMQNEQGGFALCLCHFNLSVTIDSLDPGTYFVKAFYTTTPEPAWDTCYIGTISFTIGGQNQTNNFVLTDSYQSDCFPVGIDNPEDPAENSLQVIPNPAKEKITLLSNRFKASWLTIYDGYGKKVFDTELKEDETAIDIRWLKQGIYFIQIRSETTIKTLKFVKK